MQLLFRSPSRNEVVHQRNPNRYWGPRATLLFVPSATPTGEAVKHEMTDIILLLPQLPAATDNATSRTQLSTLDNSATHQCSSPLQSPPPVDEMRMILPLDPPGVDDYLPAEPNLEAAKTIVLRTLRFGAAVN